MNSELQQLISETSSKGVFATRKSWTKMLGFVDGAFFSQVVYWATPDKDNKTKLRVFKDGHLWIAKTYEDWEEEMTIPANTVKNIVSRLSKMGLIIKDSFMFNGLRTLHIRIDFDVMSKMLEGWFQNEHPEEYKLYSQRAKNPPIEVPKKQEPKKKESITFETSDFERVVEAWNSNRGKLPEAQSLTDTRKRKIQKYFKDYGVEKTVELMIKSAKSVANNDWWNGKNPQGKMYGLDNLFHNDKLVTYAENYTQEPAKKESLVGKDAYLANQELGY